MTFDLGSGVVSIAAGLVLAALLWGARHLLLAARRRRQQVQVLDVRVQQVLGAGWAISAPTWLPTETMPQPGFDANALHAWALDNDAVDLYQTGLRLSLYSVGPAPVVVENIRAEIITRLPPAEGIRYLWESAGMGATRLMALDLDALQPIAVTATDVEDANPPTPSPWFQSNWITVDPGGHDEILLTATSTTNLVHWRLVIDTRIGNHRQSLIVDQHGTPFRTSGAATAGYRRTVAFDWARAITPDPGNTSADYLSVYDDYTYETAPATPRTKVQTILRRLSPRRRH